MKKKEIVNLIHAQEVIEQYKDLLSTIKVQRLNIEEDEKFWYPNIPEFKNYFDVLKKEILHAKKETLQSEKIAQEIDCSHEVRLKYHGLFNCYYKCVLCKKHISSDNSISFKESNYRNKHTITFDAKYQSDDDGPYEIKEGKTESEVKKMILEILKKFHDEDEVDLVEEFSKLKFAKMEINKEKRKKEKFILIIGGTNLEYLNEEDLYVTKELQNTSLSFFKYFISLLNTKVAVIDRKENINKQVFKKIKKMNNNVVLYDYTSLKDLENVLVQVKDITFHLIIDLSQIYNYVIKEHQVKLEKRDLNLNEKFPNSQIIKIVEDEKECFIVEEEGKKSFENTCGYLKRMLKK